MENNDPAAAKTTVPVMDIQPPKTIPVESTNDEAPAQAESGSTSINVVTEPEEAPETAPAEQSQEVEPVSEAPVEAPAEESAPEAEAPSTEESAPEAPAEADATPADVASSDTPAADTANPMAITPDNAGPVKHKAPMGAIVAALILAVALAGATIFAYIKTKDTSTPAKATNATVAPKTTTKQTPTETATEVQKASLDVDSSLKSIDDNTDFSSTDLNDTTLGL